MKKITYIFVIFMSFFMPQFLAALDTPLSVFIPETTPLAAERIIYHALSASDENFVIERMRGGFDSFVLLKGERTVFAATLAEFAQLDFAEEFTRIDVPIGKTGSDSFSEDIFCWYQNENAEIGEALAYGLQNIKSSGVFGRILANKSAKADDQKVIFHLSSYPEEMIWESQAEETLHETLSAYEESISLYIHNMNFRRTNYRSAQYETAASFVRSTFMDEYPDVIIAMDNDALGYLQENYRRLFYGVPVVFCGINGYNESLTSEFSEFATGLSEYIDPTETVEFALASNPDINRIYIIFDETSSASPVKASLLGTIEEQYGNKMDEITSSGNLTFAQIVEEIQSFDKNTMLLIGTYFSDKEGQFMAESEVAQRLSEAVDIPVYSLMSGYLGYGVVGGRVAYSRSFIAEAAHTAMRILQGEAVSSIPVIQERESEARFNTFIVDKKAADRFGIKENLYAGRAVILNADRNVFEEYPIQSTAAIAVILVTIITAVLCVMLIHSKRVRDLALLNAEKEKDNNRIKSEFLARMSHEIRTPLNAIIGIDELILRENISEKVHKNALVIKHSGKSLLSIINDILDFSKIESGKMELSSVDYDMGSLLYDTSSMIRVRVAEKPIDINVDISKDFPAFLYGDEIRVRQILLNVLNNSVKYTNEGQISLKAEFEFDSDEKTSGTAVFTISDTGIGIREDDMGRLFDAFSQVDTTANRKVEGTGLGLAITKTLIALMGGNITVKSEYGKGSVFTVRLRQEIHNYKALENISKAFHNHHEDEEKNNEHFIAPNASILAVDDVEANLLVICGLLEPYQVKVDTAKSGMEAVNLLLKHDYDFVFMDHMMPEMDGIEAAKKIRQFDDEKKKRIPIIALTANAISGMKEMYLENGFNDFISKPIEIKEVDRIMKDWIPIDKRQSRTNPGKSHEESARGLAAVKGVDIARGLSLFNGKVESYEKLLRLFSKDLEQRTEDILQMLEEGAFENLQICMHTIKGMSGNIGCTEIFELGKSLEDAIRNADYAYVRKNIPLFIEKAKTVTESIRENLM